MKRGTWQLDGTDLITPAGRRIPLKAIEDWAMAAWGGRQHIATQLWSGWRIVQQYLVPPGQTVRTGGIHLIAVRHLGFQARSDRWHPKKRFGGQR